MQPPHPVAQQPQGDGGGEVTISDDDEGMMMLSVCSVKVLGFSVWCCCTIGSPFTGLGVFIDVYTGNRRASAAQLMGTNDRYACPFHSSISMLTGQQTGWAKCPPRVGRTCWSQDSVLGESLAGKGFTNAISINQVLHIVNWFLTKYSFKFR
ncbi:hypothetical protein T492DRAFT_34003 [Pavlovales sp. CCMP2436]|nr:hypothetical protein T492DRAFT_34003 [Pavlovales sp. CCMP2436]